MAAPPDSPPVGRYDEEHLRRFVEARRRGDDAAMRRWWRELVVDFHDRMDGFVGASHRGRLDRDEHDEAVQHAMIRFAANLMTTFRGHSIGELVRASQTLASFACHDVQRASIARRHRVMVPLDAGGRGDDEGRLDALEAEEAERRFRADESERDVRAFLAWALPQITGTRRDVLAMTFAGAEVPEICAELGITRDNAFQRRHRGLKDLRKLKEQYES